MPELPEVETVCRGLHPVMTGASIHDVEMRRPDLRFPFPKEFRARLTNARIVALSRRAKFLRADLSTGETLLMHLGMSGRFTAETTPPCNTLLSPPPHKGHDHVVFHLSQGKTRYRVTYNDPRRFGYMDLVTTDQIGRCRHFVNLGPEPLGNDFSALYLEDALSFRRTGIKQALLDQRVVAGLGNIYVCEALFRAGISPRRTARTIAGSRARRLAGSIRAVLNAAITAGGSSLRDFADISGDTGYFQHQFDVYGRDGQNCVTCQHRIRRITQAGRSTFFCSRCQR